MKTLLTSLWVSCALCTTTMAQTVHGTYSHTWDNPTGIALTYTLFLNSNGTFIFESIRHYTTNEPTNSITVKGSWSQNGRIITLNTEPKASDDLLVRQLNGVKARYIDYPPRHHQYGQMEPSLKFYQSDAFHAKDMALERKEKEVLSSVETVATDDD